MPYLPIESHGVIGNLRTAALVGTDGTIDWLCLPRFDSPSVFGAILDDRIGGRFRVAPAADGLRHEQFYVPDTNVLITRFVGVDRAAEVEDFMPLAASDDAEAGDVLVRRVRATRGTVRLRIECRPAFDYARAEHRTSLAGPGVRFVSAGLALELASSVPLTIDGSGVVADLTLDEGQSATFVLRRAADDDAIRAVDPRDVERQFRSTVDSWRRWLSRCTYRGRWREQVNRSALTLKLLTFAPTGAMVAAPTTSLPESVGGDRNWDYRYTWVRDAAFTVYAFLRLGFTDEATRFKEYLQGFAPNPGIADAGPLRLLYGIHERSDLTERELTHLEGYRGSRPARIGNGAAGQFQLDIYGELMDAVYLHNKYVEPSSFDGWVRLRALVDWVCDNWQRADEGVWEVRSGRQHFVYSKFMAWVAVDRGLRLADKRSFPADRARWLAARDAIYEDVMRRGWNAELGAFVQAYDSSALDASTLLMPLTFFVSPSDPRMLSTIDAIRRPIGAGGLASDGLVHRYDPGAAGDGFASPEGTFNMCSFWMVEALTRAGRTDPARLDEARVLFERMLRCGNHVGLYAEQTGPRGEALGNFPQAFTHLGLISAAYNLDLALDRRRTE